MTATRYTTKEKASIEIYGRSGSFIVDLRNLSMTGALLEWTQEDLQLQRGDLLRMTIILKALNRRHNLNAEVVWRDGKKTGVNFVKTDEVLEKMMDRG
jgi:hypothetical protein